MWLHVMKWGAGELTLFSEGLIAGTAEKDKKVQGPTIYITERGHPLLYMGEPLEGQSILTVENYSKWYSLYLIHHRGTFEPIDFGWLTATSNSNCDDPRVSTPYIDHCPNPWVVQRLAEDMNWHLHEEALDMIIGRWRR